MWEDSGMRDAGRELTALAKAQRDSFTDPETERPNKCRLRRESIELCCAVRMGLHGWHPLTQSGKAETPFLPSRSERKGSSLMQQLLREVATGQIPTIIVDLATGLMPRNAGATRRVVLSSSRKGRRHQQSSD